jgi:hypothetical protein
LCGLGGTYALRFCIVNFQAVAGDIEAMPQLVVNLGRLAHAELGNQHAGCTWYCVLTIFWHEQ